MRFGSLPHTIYEMTQNRSKTLNVKAETVKLFQENMGVNPCDIGFDSFLDMTIKAQATTKR